MTRVNLRALTALGSCLCLVVSVHAQTTGSVVGWGGMVVVPPDDLTGIVAIDGGAGHSLGLRDDGSVVTWGLNSTRQCLVPAPNTGFVAISGGSGYSLGLRADGSIVAWDDNDYGQCDVPDPNSGFVAISGGGSHSLGIRASDCLPDLNGDGIFDSRDEVAFLNLWTAGC